MNILRFSIILLLVIGLVPIATAPSESADDIYHTHSLQGTPDTNNENEYVYYGYVSDVVTSNSTSGIGMWFVWKVGDNNIEQITYSANRQPDGSYKSIYEPFDGTWIIDANEVDDEVDVDIINNWITFKSGLIKTSQSDHFIVSPLPEFTFGSLIAMLFAGMIYLMIRRNVDRSANVNR